MLSCRGLRKTYQTDRGPVDAVRGADLDVAARHYVAVIGRSGSGKSSLMAMIGGLSQPSAGSILIDGADIWSLNDNAMAQFRNRRIGYIFQFPSLLPTLRRSTMWRFPLSSTAIAEPPIPITGLHSF